MINTNAQSGKWTSVHAYYMCMFLVGAVAIILAIVGVVAGALPALGCGLLGGAGAAAVIIAWKEPRLNQPLAAKPAEAPGRLNVSAGGWKAVGKGRLGMGYADLGEHRTLDEAKAEAVKHYREMMEAREPAAGDPCSRCRSLDTWVANGFDGPELVCRNCGCGT